MSFRGRGGGRGGFGGGRGGRGGRGGGRGFQRDEGPPAEVVEAGRVPEGYSTVTIGGSVSFPGGGGGGGGGPVGSAKIIDAKEKTRIDIKIIFVKFNFSSIFTLAPLGNLLTPIFGLNQEHLHSPSQQLFRCICLLVN